MKLNIQKKQGFHLDGIIIVIIGIILATLTFIRSFYGIEITDEAYYYADAYSLYQGNLPFAYNSSSVATMSFVMLPFIWVYKIFVPSMSGIFLYMRICFFFFRMVIIGMMYFVLKNRFPQKALLPTIIMLIPWTCGTIHAFSYNTISFWFIFLSGVVLSEQYYLTNEKRRYLSLFISGVFSALGVFAHPLYAICILYFILMLFIQSKSWLKVLTYCLGGIAQIMIAVVPVIVKAGINDFVSGLYIMLFQQYDATLPLLYLIKIFLIKIFFEYILLFGIFFFVLLFFKLIDKMMKRHGKIKDYWVTSVLVAFLAVVLYYKSPYYICSMAFWLFFMLLPFIMDRLTVYVGIPFILFYAWEGFLFGSAEAFGRVIYIFPLIFCIFMIFLQADNKLTNCLILAAILMISTIAVTYNYGYVYREDSIPLLTYKVPEGIYKGIYTKEETAKNIVEMEHFIRDNTDVNEKIAFKDNVPFGYLMSDGIMWDIRAWDDLQYTYWRSFHSNDPEKLYKYYKKRDAVPDKYIYIDFGRDNYWSLDEPEWVFNRWIDDYYDVTVEKEIGARYKIKLFEYNGRFDYNYDKWLE